MEMFEFVRNLAHEHETVVSVSLFVAILCVCLVIGHLLEENRWVNESITAIITFTFSGVTWDPVNAAMITNTIIVVLFTTLVFGFLTKPLILCLLPQPVTDTIDDIPGPKSPKEDMTLPLVSFEASASASTNILRAKDNLSMLIERPIYTVHFYWRKFDDK